MSYIDKYPKHVSKIDSPLTERNLQAVLPADSAEWKKHAIYLPPWQISLVQRHRQMLDSGFKVGPVLQELPFLFKSIDYELDLEQLKQGRVGSLYGMEVICDPPTPDKLAEWSCWMSIPNVFPDLTKVIELRAS